MNLVTTVYIIGWNGDDWLPACLENLNRASEQRMHLVIIDNHNNPGIEDLPLDRFETRVVKTPKKMGFADAHNFGIIAAPPEDGLVVLLNQDTKSGDGWIDQIVDCFEKDEKLGAMMPGLRTYDGSGWDVNFLDCARDNKELVGELGAVPNEQHSGDLFELPVVTAAAMAVRTELLKEIAMFDPIFESYYEDIDYCRRIREAGWKLGVCPAARVYHFVGSATTNREAELRRHRWVLRNRVIHEARLREGRMGFVLKHFCLDIPRRLLRSLMCTPSSQPMSAIIKSQMDLIRLLPRLVSVNKDDKAWQQALTDMKWPWRDGTE